MLLRGHFILSYFFMALPNHVAIIPDGNRRWARAKGLKPWEGHMVGTKLYWEIGYEALDLGVKHITFWAGSYDNLKKRSKIEVKFLIKLAITELEKPTVLEECEKYQVRFRLIGQWREFVKDKKAVAAIENLEKQTAHFTEKTQTILFAYDGKREMEDAIQTLTKNSVKATEKTIRESIWTGGLPDVDLVIRTGGEPHWSAGFMMWLTANSQFYFTEKLWPDFSKKELKKALDDYESRERRLGK